MNFLFIEHVSVFALFYKNIIIERENFVDVKHTWKIPSRPYTISPSWVPPPPCRTDSQGSLVSLDRRPQERSYLSASTRLLNNLKITMVPLVKTVYEEMI